MLWLILSSGSCKGEITESAAPGFFPVRGIHSHTYSDGWQIWFSVVVGLTFPNPCWLSAWTDLQLLEAIPIPHHMAPPVS